MKFFLLTVALIFIISIAYGQANRLTDEEGQLLWQFNQIAKVDDENQNRIKVTFVFINGINQTAVSLRQEFFYSQIEWVATADIQVETEKRAEFLTANLSPHQAIVWKYLITPKPSDKELSLEKSAILIMNEDFEIRKEIIPMQKILLR